MRAEFLRAPAGPAAATGGTFSRRLLRAYLDLTDSDGPIHAQGVADAGAHLAEGRAIPTYQINTASLLRTALAAEPGGGADPVDPLDVPAADRSPRWEALCAGIEQWPALADAERVRIAAVLNKLGFWHTLARLVPPGLPADRTPHLARLALLRCNALFKSGEGVGGDLAAFQEARRIQEMTARHEAFPAETRLSAAVGLIVHHAKSDKTLSVIDCWAEEAARLLKAAGAEGTAPVTVSAYWRAVSFLPFLRGDGARVRGMLDDAEAAARAALRDPATAPLAARENLHPLLETRARAWSGAGEADSAERYYRELAELDPLDPKVHVRLGDFLLKQSRSEQAREAYEQAALLGAPYTAYALTQAGRCSHRLGEPERAVSSLMQAVRNDPRAVTPLAALREVAGSAGLSAVGQWAAIRLDLLTRAAAGRPRTSIHEPVPDPAVPTDTVPGSTT